jgi:hypothetical protein
MFSSLMSKVFGHAPKATTIATTTTIPAAPPPSAAPAAPPPAAAAPASQPVAASQPPPAAAPVVVDVTAILDDLAAKNREKLDWKKSIVDLMKLVGMDSSLAARKELAQDLHYTGDMNDSAKMNMWLHKEVLKRFAANGGTVPKELLG